VYYELASLLAYNNWFCFIVGKYVSFCLSHPFNYFNISLLGLLPDVVFKVG